MSVLLVTGHPDAARVLRCSNVRFGQNRKPYGEATLQAPLSAMARIRRIRNKTPEMQAGIDAVLSDARHSLSMRAKLLEQRLEGRDFLVAGRMTLADISVGYPLNNMGKPDFASLLGPRATAYRERLRARPAFQRAAAVP